MKNFLLFSICLSCYLVAIGQQFDHSFMEEYDSQGIQYFRLSTSDGFIDVKPSPSENLRVYFIVEKGGQRVKITREELENEVELLVNSSGNELRIKIRQRDNFHWSNWKNRFNVSCEVLLPSRISCDLNTSDGDIRIREMEAGQKLHTSDGDIRATAIRGDVEAVSSDGDLMVEQILGRLSVRTSDGDIKVTDVSGDATCITSDGDIALNRVSGITEATSSDGDIRFEDLSGGLMAETSDGDVRGSILNLKKSISIVTSDGDIELVLPANSAMDLTMKGEDLELPRVQLNGKMDEHHIEGQVNGGGVPVRLITSDGHIELSFR